MSRSLKTAVLGGLLLGGLHLSALAGPYNLGREALPEEVAAWDIDVRPDGQGLPAGSGTVLAGEEIFAERCASCHGEFGEGSGRWPVLAGGEDTLDSEDPVKTVGSYWPYLSTVFDYVHRAMPFGEAQTLSNDDTYAVVAYILYLNDLMGEEGTLDRESFTQVVMPNAEGFFMDDRARAEPAPSTAVCMKECKDEVKITKRARILDVTPDEEKKTAAKAAAAPADAVQNAVAPEQLAKGQKLFKRCASCHSLEKGKHRTGPSLHAVMGREAASVEGFRKYSNALKKAGVTWTDDAMDAFLLAPRKYIKGTRMSFAGMKKDGDREALIVYLKSVGAGGS